jgi:hypothetical protein
MADIRYFKLHNAGAFVARMQVKWTGNDGQGNESHGTYEPSGYHDVCAAAERTIDLNDTNIPDGACVTLKVVVVLGKDNTADETYTYKRDCGDTAYYKISGTTLNNHLKQESCE